ncbi:MAG: DUF1684 domain-containing protein [Chloroflexota bacterium]|nr:DUF1684 domain-containing protein [Chloroflexota bacterium]
MTTTPSRLTSFRERKDQYYGSDPHSPLSEAQRTAFTGMRYYDERPDLVFELPIDTSGEDVGEHLEIPTSDGQAKHYVRAGRIRFEADGQPVTLTVFKDVERGRYFLPFRDGTSGKETYGAGRYLDPKTRPDGTLVVDFNYAYNPYCAYGEGWSCPIPPLENFARPKIEAGERRFHDDD